MERHPAAKAKKLVTLFNAAYWFALLLIAAMITTSYILLHQMMASHREDEALLSLLGEQKTLSQRVVFLAGMAEHATPRKKPPLIEALRQANGEFERNYDRLLTEVEGADPELHSGAEQVNDILFESPFHLDYFSTSLAANGWRLIAKLERQLSPHIPGGPAASFERAQLDDTVANATLTGYVALEERVAELAQDRLSQVLATHRILFIATIGIIVLVTVLIFRPMARMIGRKTSELIEARNTMAFVAMHDGLTGLYNRTFLNNHLDSMLEQAQRRGERVAVVQFDLDRFKQVNDTLGHAAGDHVLTRIAERMRTACTTADLCARLGGDEFVMVLAEGGSTDYVTSIVRRALSSINQPIDYEGKVIQPGASAGVAIYPDDAGSKEELLVHADLALYAAKEIGGGAFSFFSDNLLADLQRSRALEEEIKHAIAERSFSVYFQPQISLSTGKVTGVEALARWKHPEKGMISPGEFLPVAEKAGLMAQLGRIVIEKAISEAAKWDREGIAFGRLAVNVSSLELLETDFSEFLFNTLRAAGLPPQKLSLEIIESVILDDEKTGIAEKLRSIRAAGIHLELDDFGTGYASLSHISPDEIDRLKIDRRFVHNIDTNEANAKIVRAITELAHGLGLSIVAEGAEEDMELQTLLSLGCDQVQGFSVAFPMPEDEARRWLTIRGHKVPTIIVKNAARRRA